MDNEPNGRRLHHWIGKDRTADIAELADTIAAVGKLFNHDGVIVQLDPTGKLIQLNLAGLRAFIDQHICGVRLVALDNGWQWQRQYFTYQYRGGYLTLCTGRHRSRYRARCNGVGRNILARTGTAASPGPII